MSKPISLEYILLIEIYRHIRKKDPTMNEMGFSDESAAMFIRPLAETRVITPYKHQLRVGFFLGRAYDFGLATPSGESGKAVYEREKIELGPSETLVAEGITDNNMF